MRIIRMGYCKKMRFAYIQANFWERIFIDLKIKKRNSGVFRTQSLGAWVNKAQYLIVPRSTKGHGLFSDKEKAKYFGSPPA